MGAVAKLATQVTEGETDENLAGTHVESFALNGGKDFNQPCGGISCDFGGHLTVALN
jgi:hypothetical protein